MIYIRINEFGRANEHHMPFHPEYGLNKSKEELEKEGFFVENIPEPIEQVGKVAILKGDSENKELWYEYEERSLSEQEEVKLLKQENESLKQSQAEQDMIIMELLFR
ncbi:hypothetical protein ACJ2A9_21225 [Anaerobacillus sp. MEB173]|uniref:hypothetical protein n=1 Tax=Anaerobacillus sp. MEB173 TaxID=3383345 RepID=UPI003F92EF25